MDIQHLEQELSSALASVKDEAGLEAVRVEFLGRKGKLAEAMQGIGSLSIEEKKTAGAALNAVKQKMDRLFAVKTSEIEHKKASAVAETEWIDVTQPIFPVDERGHLHPVTQVAQDLEDLFSSMGFVIADGPELESDFFNFTALNIPPTHPARDMQDTFYVSGHEGMVMRTHTSPVQIRAMRKFGTPLRMIAPGRCFRNEATDVRHEHTFHQLEGMVVDRGINLSHMKGVLLTVARHLYGPKTEVRLRPKFYPFVEPGVNGEVTCFLCSGNGCRVCKQSGWLEVFGAGMVHPHVLAQGGVNAKEFSGFAFGFGLTRLVMLKYGIDDIRYLESGDLRFLNQF